MRIIELEFKTIRVDGKQMTHSLFRQIPIEENNVEVSGEILGFVNYFPESQRKHGTWPGVERRNILWFNKEKELRRIAIDIAKLPKDFRDKFDREVKQIFITT